MDVIRAVKNSVNKIAFTNQFLQNIIQSVRKEQSVLCHTVIKWKIVTASGKFVITLSAFPVGVQFVPPSNYLFKIGYRSCGILQTGKSFCLQFPFEFFAFTVLIWSVIFNGIFGGIGFQLINELLFL